MSNPRKAKGSKAEADVVKWLKKWYPYAERRIAGSQLDKGDIAGVNGVVGIILCAAGRNLIGVCVHMVADLFTNQILKAA